MKGDNVDKRIMIWVIFIIVIYAQLNGSGLLLPWSAQSVASCCSGFISQDAGVITSCPALQVNGICLSSTKLYNMDELPRYIFAVSNSWKGVAVGYFAEHLHHTDYQETNQLINVSYGNEHLRIGANIRSLLVKITDEDMQSAMLCDLGILWRTSSISASFSCLNTFESKIDGEKLPVYGIWEINWRLIEAGSLGLRVEKESGYEFMPSLACSYKIGKVMRIIGSFSREPETVGCGFEISYKQMKVAWGIQYHSELEESHYITVNYAFPD